MNINTERTSTVYNIKELTVLDKEYFLMRSKLSQNPFLALEDEVFEKRLRELDEILSKENMGNLRHVIHSLINHFGLTIEALASTLNIAAQSIDGLLDGTHITKTAIISLCEYFELHVERYNYYLKDAL
ncbi:hypothetical protein [Paenibacillus sp. FSL P4-0288]|uniref:hypothetical protein n=1 Tax=Paenibacillus sp. FSL P4-0288 TaxID=2921633 RepID=UPI0030F55308